jgi:hypothetical protein
MAIKAAVGHLERVSSDHLARNALTHEIADARDGGLPQGRCVDAPGAKVRSDHLDRLVEHLLRLDALHLDHLSEETISAASARRGKHLAVEPRDCFLGGFERRRVRPHHDHVAALPRREARACHQLDLGLLRLGRGHDCRHVPEIANLLLVGEHRVDDDCSLQGTLELDRAPGRQVFLPQIEPADHHS